MTIWVARERPNTEPMANRTKVPLSDALTGACCGVPTER